MRGILEGAAWSAVAALLLFVACGSRDRPGGRPRVVERTDTAPRALARAIADLGADTLRWRGDALPAETLRAVLDAGRRGGVPLTLPDADRWPRFAITAEARARPRGGVQLAATAVAYGAAARGAPETGDEVPRDSLIVRDAIGRLDAVRGDAAARWSLVESPTTARADVGGTVARTVTRPRDPASLTGRALLIASPGWEARFATEAIEAAGYAVDGRLTIAPTATVTLGTPRAVTREAYDVVVALDAAALRRPAAAALVRALPAFVNDGGGLILLGDAALAAPSVRAAPLVEGAARRPALPGALRSDEPLDGLEAVALARLPEGTGVLTRSQRADRAPLVVARRVGRGRVVQAAVLESWPWRMLGGDDAASAHAAWWDALLERAAPSPAAADAIERARLATGDASAAGDAAPWVDLVARLGDPERVRAPASPWPALPATAPPPWWGIVAAAVLALVWVSRRQRGVR